MPLYRKVGIEAQRCPSGVLRGKHPSGTRRGVDEGQRLVYGETDDRPFRALCRHPLVDPSVHGRRDDVFHCLFVAGGVVSSHSPRGSNISLRRRDPRLFLGKISVCECFDKDNDGVFLVLGEPKLTEFLGVEVR